MPPNNGNCHIGKRKTARNKTGNNKQYSSASELSQIHNQAVENRPEIIPKQHITKAKAMARTQARPAVLRAISERKTTCWKKVFTRIKADNNNLQIPRVRQLRKAIRRITRRCSIHRNEDLDKEKGGIYVIYNKKNKKLYVGLTTGTIKDRYIKHVNDGSVALRQTGNCSSRLDAIMAERPLAEVGVMCLERITETEFTSHDDFKKYLLQREGWWMRQLHTFWPRGFNVNGCHKYKERRIIHRPEAERELLDHAGVDAQLQDHANEVRRRRQRMIDNFPPKSPPEITAQELQKQKRKATRERADLRKRAKEAEQRVPKPSAVDYFGISAEVSNEIEDTSSDEFEDSTKDTEDTDSEADQTTEDMIMESSKLRAAETEYDIWQCITEFTAGDNTTGQDPPTDIKTNWQEMPYDDIDCDDTWNLVTAVSLRMKSNNFNPSSLKEWPTGTLQRILATIRWAQKRHTTFNVRHNWMGIGGIGGVRDLQCAFLTELRSRAALRQINNANREILITPYCNKTLDLLDLESINQSEDIRALFPEELACSVGYPVMGWKYGDPQGRSIINEKGIIAKTQQLSRQSCSCHLIDEKYKDASGHVVTADLNIIQLRNYERT